MNYKSEFDHKFGIDSFSGSRDELGKYLQKQRLRMAEFRNHVDEHPDLSDGYHYDEDGRPKPTIQ